MVEETSKNNLGEPDWDALQNVWQDTPSVDMAKLARNARFVWWRMRANFALEVAFSLIGMFVFGSLIDFSSHSATLFGLVGAVFCVASLWASVYIRRGVWSEADEDALGLVRLQIKRAQSELLYVRVNCWSGYAALVLLLLALWFFYDRIDTVTPDRILAARWFFGLAFAAIIIFPFATRPFMRRKRELIEKLQKVEAELSEAENLH